MSHLDEGQLAALLDDELDPGQKLAVEAHLAACAECRAVWEETRAFAAEADRLVATIELPPKPLPLAHPPASAPGGSLPTPGRRPIPWRTLAWAASVLMAVGLGYSLRSVSRPTPDHSGAQPASAGGEMAAVADKAAAPAAPDSHMMAMRSDRSEAPAPQTPPPAASRPAQPARSPAAAEPEKQADQVGNQLEERTMAQTGRAERDAAPVPSVAAETAAPQAGESGALRAGSANAPGAPKGFSVPVSGGLRQVDLESAVRTLAGSIRLLDGLEPVQVLAGPGRALPGGDPLLEGIRVVYLDPPGRELWLDQQRTRPESDTPLARRAAGFLPGDTVLVTGTDGTRSLRWIDQDGFRLALTGFLSADSLRALIPRVR